MGPVSDSSKCSDNNTQEISWNNCENCSKLSSEHEKILEEPKSAEVNGELLRAEVNANIASEYAMQNSTNKIQVENQDYASENRWIKVITDHHTGTRREVFHQTSKQIDVANRFALLTNLQVQASIIGSKKTVLHIYDGQEKHQSE